MLDIRELIRQLQAGQSARQIAENMQLSRVTVGKYRTWAVTHDLLNHALPTAEQLADLLAQDQVLQPSVSTVSSVEPYRAVVVDLRQRGLEMMAVFQRLRDDHDYAGTYSSVRRFVQALEPVQPDATIRIERLPGEEVQVDFGYAGLMFDTAGQVRRAWAFVTPSAPPLCGNGVTLAYSRHQYVEFVFDQSVETWLVCHQHAFEYFGGVPRKVVG